MVTTVLNRGRTGRAGLLALGLGAALLLPTAGFAQKADDAKAQQEKIIADLAAQIDALIKEKAAAEWSKAAPKAEDAARKDMADLRAKLAELMKARAGAEFSGYAQEVEKERAQAALKRLDAGKLNADQVAERDRYLVELRRAEAAAQQKAAQVREMEAQVQAVTGRLQAAGAAAQRSASGAKEEQPRSRVETKPADPTTPDADKIKVELQKLEAELQKKTAEAQQLRAQIEMIRAKAKQEEGAKAKVQAKQDDQVLRLWLGTPDQKGGEPQEIILRKVDGAWKVMEAKEKKEIRLRLDTENGRVLEKLLEVPATPRAVAPPAAVPNPPAGVRLTPPGQPAPQMPPAAPLPPAAAGVNAPTGGFWTTPAIPPGASGTRPPVGEPNNRIENLEKKLDKMMQLLDQMRKDMDGGRGKKAGGSEEETRREAPDNLLEDQRKRAVIEQQRDRAEILKRVLEEAKKKDASKPEAPRQ